MRLVAETECPALTILSARKRPKVPKPTIPTESLSALAALAAARASESKGRAASRARGGGGRERRGRCCCWGRGREVDDGINAKVEEGRCLFVDALWVPVRLPIAAVAGNGREANTATGAALVEARGTPPAAREETAAAVDAIFVFVVDFAFVFRIVFFFRAGAGAFLLVARVVVTSGRECRKRGERDLVECETWRRESGSEPRKSNERKGFEGR